MGKIRSDPKKRKKKKKSLDMYVITALLYIIAWSVTFFVAWVVKDNEPSVLEGCILAPGVVELVACAWIKAGKTKWGQSSPDQGISDGMQDYNDTISG